MSNAANNTDTTITLSASEISHMDAGDNIAAIKSVAKRTGEGLGAGHALVHKRLRYSSLDSLNVTKWRAAR